MEWKKITTRPLTGKENFYSHLDVVMEGEFPNIDEEVIVYTKSGGMTTDYWIDYGSGVGFENTLEADHPTIYWIHFPELPKEVE